MNARSLGQCVTGLALVLLAAAAAPALDGPARDVAPVRLPGESIVVAQEVPRLKLAWYDVHGAASGAYGVTRAEASRLLERMGIDSDWRRGKVGEASAAEEMRVIVLNQPARRRSAGHLAMGAVPLGSASGSLWVYLPSVVTALGWSPGSIGPGSELWRRRDLGTALGRVVAHEVVHLLAPQLPHGGGLMSSSLNRRQLLAGKMPIDPEIVPVVQATLREGAGAATPSRTLLAVGGANRRD